MSSLVSPSSQAAPRRLLLAFMLTTVLAPATILNKILFVILMVWTLMLMMRQRQPRPRLMVPAFAAIGIFLYGLMLCLPAANDTGLAIQLFLSTFVLMLIHFVDHFHIDMDSAAETCGRAMVAATLIYLLFIVNPDLPYADGIVRWINESSMAASSERDYLSDDARNMTLSLGTGPFLFVPWCLITTRLFRQRRLRDFGWLVVYGAMIALAGARGVAVVALIFLATAAVWLTSSRTRYIVFAALTLIFAVGVPILLSSTSLFSSDEASNAGKIGHFQSFLETIDWPGALFGHGLGSLYYSSGKGAMTAQTELTPLDLTRYFGAPLAIAFYAMLLFPYNGLIHYRRTNLLFSIGFFLFLILSITNPTLVNSYGMLVVVWYWAKVRRPAERHASAPASLAT